MLLLLSVRVQTESKFPLQRTLKNESDSDGNLRTLSDLTYIFSSTRQLTVFMCMCPFVFMVTCRFVYISVRLWLWLAFRFVCLHARKVAVNTRRWFPKSKNFKDKAGMHHAVLIYGDYLIKITLVANCS